ncbi:MAG: hypothetical protein GY749_36425 [Desulfobacteraceae bacterium]|nr:hypothetical protein [Desulfobacteraceae bacterium]
MPKYTKTFDRVLNNQGEVGKKIKILPKSFLKYCHYIVFSKNAPKEAVERVKVAVETLENNGELAKIRASFILPQK